MDNPEEDKSKLVKRYSRLAIICAYLFALFWPLGSFFFWIFIGAATWFGFLAFYHRPRSVREKPNYENEKVEFDGPPTWKSAKPTASVPVSSKKIKLIVLLIGMMVFLTTIITLIIEVASGEDNSTNVEQTSSDNDREMLLNDPNNLDALTNIGNTFYANDQFDSALVYYERVLKIDPKNNSGLYNKGLALYAKKDYSKSMESLRLCLSLYPDNLDGYIVMGDNYYSQNQPAQAMYWYKQAYDKGARTSGLLNMMAYLHDQQNQRPDAIRLYKEALQLDSSLVDVYSRLAELEPNRADWYKKKAEAWK